MIPPLSATLDTSTQGISDKKSVVLGCHAEGRKQRKYTPRVNHGGNFCGHDPAKPRFVSTVNPYEDEGWTGEMRDSFGHKRKHSFFYNATEILQEAYFYPKTAPSLTYLEKDDGVERRLHRTEARSNDINLMTVLTHHVELASINWEKGFARVGVPTEQGLMYYDTKYYMEKTGLSASQLKHAFSRLAKKGHVKRQRRWVERDKGKFKALTTMTTISLDFYRELGLLDQLKDAAKYAYENLKETAIRLQTKASKMLRCAVESVSPKQQSPVVKNMGQSTDYPATNPKHWECKLKHQTQRDAFRHRYLELMLQQGVEGDLASIYREAYLSVKKRRE